MKQEVIQAEQKLSIALQNLSDCLVNASGSSIELYQSWAKILIEFKKDIDSIDFSKWEIKKKYSFLKKIEEIWGGMGSFSDIIISENCREKSEILYLQVQDLLRLYWHALGRVFYKYSSFKLFEVGSIVRLIPGSVSCYTLNDIPYIVKQEEREEIWKVVKVAGRDVTNMPEYLIGKGNEFRYVRHEAIRLLSDDEKYQITLKVKHCKDKRNKNILFILWRNLLIKFKMRKRIFFNK